LKNQVGFVVRALMALLASAASLAQAFTLGDLRGTAVIGHELDVSVRVQASAEEELSTSCMGAEVYFADARQKTPALTIVPGTQGQSQVRVQLAVAVSEPVVTVLLRSTCGSTSMRRYVLLADFAQDASTAPVVGVTAKTAQPSAMAAEPAPTRGLPTASSPQMAQTAKPDTPPKEASSRRSSKARKATTKPDAPAPEKVAKTADRPKGKSVLKLDPLDMLSDRIDLLDSTMLFAPTEDALKQTQQIATLQNDVKTLRDVAAKNDAKLADMRTQLQQAQSQQLPMLLVYALLLLVILCLAAVAWLWQQHRKARHGAKGAWWHDSQSDQPSTVLMPQASGSPAAPMPASPVSTPLQATVPEAAHEADLDIDLDHFMLGTGKPANAASGAQKRPSLIHCLQQEAILDIRQQAEFFLSLGQTDQALQILKTQVDEDPQPHPAVYLDLLALYYSLGLKAEFHDLRDAFARQFNALLPDFQAFQREGKDLQAYSEVLADLAPLWPGIKALAFLDACIFYNPGAQVMRPMFDLAAFRDLLMLHDLAEELTPDLASLEAALTSLPLVPVPRTKVETHLLPTDEPSATLSEQTVPLPLEEPSTMDEPPDALSAHTLDFDFSNLSVPAADALPDSDAVDKSPLRYPDRSRWPVFKDPE